MLNLLETMEEMDEVSASAPLGLTDEQGIPASLKVDDACGVSSSNITPASKSKLN